LVKRQLEKYLIKVRLYRKKIMSKLKRRKTKGLLPNDTMVAPSLQFLTASERLAICFDYGPSCCVHGHGRERQNFSARKKSIEVENLLDTSEVQSSGRAVRGGGEGKDHRVQSEEDPPFNACAAIKQD
jgi:hypothetical protein